MFGTNPKLIAVADLFMQSENDPDDTLTIAITQKELSLILMGITSLDEISRMTKEVLPNAYMEIHSIFMQLTGKLAELIRHQKVEEA